MNKNILISILFIVLLVVSVATIVVENRFCVSLVWVFGFYGITNKYSFRLLRILTGVVLPVDVLVYFWCRKGCVYGD